MLSKFVRGHKDLELRCLTTVLWKIRRGAARQGVRMARL